MSWNPMTFTIPPYCKGVLYFRGNFNPAQKAVITFRKTDTIFYGENVVNFKRYKRLDNHTDSFAFETSSSGEDLLVTIQKRSGNGNWTSSYVTSAYDCVSAPPFTVHEIYESIEAFFTILWVSTKEVDPSKVEDASGSVSRHEGSHLHGDDHTHEESTTSRPGHHRP